MAPGEQITNFAIFCIISNLSNPSPGHSCYLRNLSLCPPEATQAKDHCVTGDALLVRGVQAVVVGGVASGRVLPSTIEGSNCNGRYGFTKCR